MGRRRLARTDFCAIGQKYAQQVLANEIQACKWVRLACQRQFDDLERSKSGDFRWRFAPEFGNRVCRFIENLPHVKGRWTSPTIVLEPWQCFQLAVIFGWVDKHDDLRR